MGFAGLPLVTDADLGYLEPEATDSAAPWGASSWPKQRAQAKREIATWLEMDYGAGAADRLVDRWNPDKVFRYTGGSFVDVTTEASDDNEEDIDLAAALATVGTDRLYVGCEAEYDGLYLKLLESLNAVTSVLTAKYWGPAGWTALVFTDGTALAGKTLAQSGNLRWSVPANWEPRRLNGTGEEYFWVELAISVALTSGTTATQIVPTRMPEGLRQVACYLALGYIMRGLAAQAANPDEWKQRGADYLDDGAALYARLKASGAVPLDLNHDQVTQPSERTTAPRTARLLRG